VSASDSLGNAEKRIPGTIKRSGLHFTYGSEKDHEISLAVCLSDDPVLAGSDHKMAELLQAFFYTTIYF
jgi:hypothetical protein